MTAAFESKSSPPDEDWTYDFVVLTMAPNGAWGVGSHPLINRAIVIAIENCNAMSGMQPGCGGEMTSIRAGWTLGFRCGPHNILVADHDLDEAERRAFNREVALRDHYYPDMPPCARLVTVTPGSLVIPTRPNPADHPADHQATNEPQ